MLRRLISLLFLPLVACTANPGAPKALSASQATSPVLTTAKSEAALPNIELTNDLILRFLVGDIAAQRGQADLGATAWLDIAQRTHDPRAAQRAAELAVYSARMDLAIEAAKIWGEAAPQNGDALRLLISLRIRANQLEGLDALIDQADIDQSAEWSSFFTQLHLLWNSKADLADVRRYTERLCQGQASRPEARFALAVMHGIQNRNELALKELDASLKLRPWWEAAVLYKAQLLMQTQQTSAAIQWLRQAVNQNPQQRSFSLVLARFLVEDKQEDEAARLYADILKQDPNDNEALLGAADLALAKHDYEAAYSLLSRADAQASSNPDLLRLQLAFIQEQRGNTKEALALYQNVEGKDKYRAQLQVPRLYAELKQRNAANQALSALQPSNEAETIDKLRTEAQVLRLFKEYKQGRELLNQAIIKHPQELDLYYDRSIFADYLGDVPAAIKDLRYVVSKEPENVTYINALGYLLADRTEQLAEAEVLLKQAISKDPDNATIIDSVGWLYYRQGKLNEAQNWLSRAYKLMPDPEIAAHYAETLWKLGQTAQAKTILDTAFKKSPDNDVLIQTRQRLGMK